MIIRISLRPPFMQKMTSMIMSLLGELWGHVIDLILPDVRPPGRPCMDCVWMLDIGYGFLTFNINRPQQPQHLASLSVPSLSTSPCHAEIFQYVSSKSSDVQSTFSSDSSPRCLHPGLVAAGPWHTRCSTFPAPPSILYSLGPTITPPGCRPFTCVAPHLSIAATRLSLVAPRISRHHIVAVGISRRFRSALPLHEASVDSLHALLESNAQSVHKAFSQLPTEPLSFLQASPDPLLQALNARPLLLQVTYNHVRKVLHTYTNNVRIINQTAKTKNKPALPPKLKTQLSDSYVRYRDFWEETASSPEIHTAVKQRMTQAIRQHQLDLLIEVEDWKEIYLLVQELQKEAREERMARPEGEVKDKGKKENMAVHDIYEDHVREDFFFVSSRHGAYKTKQFSAVGV